MLLWMITLEGRHLRKARSMAATPCLLCSILGKCQVSQQPGRGASFDQFNYYLLIKPRTQCKRYKLSSWELENPRSAKWQGKLELREMYLLMCDTCYAIAHLDLRSLGKQY